MYVPFICIKMRHNCNEIVVNFKVYPCIWEGMLEENLTLIMSGPQQTFVWGWKKTGLNQCVMNTERDSNLRPPVN